MLTKLELDFTAQCYLDEMRWLGSLKFISANLNSNSSEAIAIEQAIALLEQEILILEPKKSIAAAIQENGVEAVLTSFLRISEESLVAQGCPEQIKPILQQLIGKSTFSSVDK